MPGGRQLWKMQTPFITRTPPAFLCAVVEMLNKVTAKVPPLHRTSQPGPSRSPTDHSQIRHQNHPLNHHQPQEEGAIGPYLRAPQLRRSGCRLRSPPMTNMLP